jgi:hypothetical protein
VVGEWDILKPALRHVLVEGRPSAVTALEAEKPLESPFELLGTPDRFRVGSRRLLFRGMQRHEHHHRVVGIGVIVVPIFERPPARLRRRIFAGPIAAKTHFSLGQPGGGLFEGEAHRRIVWMKGGFFVVQGASPRVLAAFGHGNGGDGGIPHRRETRLDAKILRVINEQALEVAPGLGEDRMVAGIAE